MSDEAEQPPKESTNSPKPMSLEKFVDKYVTFRKALLTAENQASVPLTDLSIVKELFGMWLSDKRAMEVLDLELKIEVQRIQDDHDHDDGDQQDWWAQDNEGEK